jgi:hypothetical protein
LGAHHLQHGRIGTQRGSDHGRGDLDDPGEPRRDGDAVARELDGRFQQDVRCQPAEPFVRIGPRPDRAGNGDRGRTAHRDRAVARRSKGRRVDARCRATGAVQRELRPRSRVPDEPERVAAEAAALGRDDTEHSVRRDRGVDRGAPGA